MPGAPDAGVASGDFDSSFYGRDRRLVCATSHIDSTIFLYNRSISAYLFKRIGGKKDGPSRALEY